MAGNILLVNSGSWPFTEATLKKIKSDFPDADLYIVTQNHAYEACQNLSSARDVFLINNISSLWTAARKVRKLNMDASIVLLTGEVEHHKLKFFVPIFKSNRRFIFTKYCDYFALTPRNWLRFSLLFVAEIKELSKRIVLKIFGPLIKLITYPITLIFLAAMTLPLLASRKNRS